MRIAHVLRRISFDDWGGTEQVVWNIAKAQRRAGHDVRLFATTALSPRREETVDGLDIVRFRPVYPWWPMTRRLAAELDRKGGNPFVPGLGKALREWKPDVIHCHAMARIAELCLRTGGRGTGSGERVKTVVSLHGGGANVPEAEAKSLMAPTRGLFPWGKLVDYAMGWTRRVPEDFDGIVCVGEDEAERYKARHPHVLYLPNGVDTKVFGFLGSGVFGSAKADGYPRNPNTQTSSHLTTQLRNHLSLLCVARIDRQKNQMMLVEALARHPEATARLVGPVTQPDYRAELEARAAELGVSSRLSFAGALKPGSGELLSEYAKADVFVLPSRHEPFGIVVLEAWAAGLPVVASDVGGLGRLCAAHPGAAAVFAPGDAAALDAALGRARQEGVRMGELGRAAAAQYDWDVLSARLVDFYARI